MEHRLQLESASVTEADEVHPPAPTEPIPPRPRITMRYTGAFFALLRRSLRDYIAFTPLRPPGDRYRYPVSVVLFCDR